MTPDAIRMELQEIEKILQDERLAETDLFALFGAQQALLWLLDRNDWQSPSQAYYRIGPLEGESKAYN